MRGNGDLYNLFNASNVLRMTTRYSGTNGGQWLRPLQISAAACSSSAPNSISDLEHPLCRRWT